MFLFNNLKALLKTKLKPTDFVVKNLSTATQIRVNNAEIYATTLGILKEANIDHYTYVNNAPKLKKFVMFGLCNEEEDEILSNIKEYGLIPAKLVAMKNVRNRTNLRTNYLVYFEPDDNAT